MRTNIGPPARRIGTSPMWMETPRALTAIAGDLANDDRTAADAGRGSA